MAKELTIEAAVENIGIVTAFVDEQLEALECPLKAQMQIDIACSFSNAAVHICMLSDAGNNV